MRVGLTALLFFVSTVSFGQIDTLVYGRVQTIREKLYFLDSLQQNYRLLDIDVEYGHSGFISPEYTTMRFNLNWVGTRWTHYMNYKRQFSESGLLLKEDWYYKDNDSLRSYFYTYDSNDKLTKTRIVSAFADETECYRKYDYKGRLVSAVSVDKYKGFSPSDEEMVDYFYCAYSYDEMWRLNKIVSYDYEGKPVTTRRYYNDKGMLEKVTVNGIYIAFPNPDGSSTMKKEEGDKEHLLEEYVYDEAGRCTEKRFYAQEEIPRLYRDTRCSFDKKGRLVRTWDASIDPDGGTFYTYRDENLIEKKRVSTKFPDSNETITYRYNERDLVEEMIVANAKGNTSCVFTYKFDHKNNWIEQIKSVNGKPLYLRKRKIEYYD